MAHPLFIVDAFAEEPFRGNPAAVCLLDHPEEPAWMQLRRRRAETSPKPHSSCSITIACGSRWSTPETGSRSLRPCHAGRGTCPVGMWKASPSTARSAFETKSGRLTCTHRREWIRNMDFPAEPAHASRGPRPLIPRGPRPSPAPCPQAKRNRARITPSSNSWTNKPSATSVLDFRRPGQTTLPRHHSHRSHQAARAMILFHASLPPPPASTKIRSRAQATAASAPTGPASSRKKNSLATRLRRAAASSKST